MKFLHLAIRNIRRRPVRTALTALGAAVSVFIFAALLALHHGVDRMVETTGGDRVVTVFQKHAACPPYSRLPAHYSEAIAAMPNVSAAMPVRFLLSTCRTTTDLVAVHGIDPAAFPRFRTLELDGAAYQAFAAERGAALAGRAVAAKYGWRVGDQVTLRELRGVSFTIRGIYGDGGSSLESVILVDREYLERSVGQPGVATMLLVLVDDGADAGAVSAGIDAEFASHPAQTRSGPERDFISGIIGDFRDLVGFAQAVALAALALLLAAVANSASMSVRDSLREIAILRTLGFKRGRVIRLVLTEAVLVATVAAAIGLAAAAAVIHFGGFSVAVEGYTIVPMLSLGVCLLSLGAGAALGAAGAIMPAWRASRIPVVTALREVD